MVESNGLKDMEPLKSTGDGNCLFNSISILLIGSEDLAPLLPVLSFFLCNFKSGKAGKVGKMEWHGPSSVINYIII